MGGHEQVAERLAVASSHSSAQLVEFAESELLRVVHDYGVDVGHVDAALYDGGGE